MAFRNQGTDFLSDAPLTYSAGVPNPYDSNSEDPAEKALARSWEQAKDAAFMQQYGLTAAPDFNMFGNVTADNIQKAQGVDELLSGYISASGAIAPAMVMTDAEKQAVIQQVASNNDADFLKYLTPEQRQIAQAYITEGQQSHGLDGMGKFLQAAVMAGMGGLALGPYSLMGAEAAGGLGAGGLTDAAWGVNAAADGAGLGEFSLAGGTAGGAGGGLSSAAGGVTGLTPAGAGVTGLTGTASAGSLLTPAMAASMGLPASAAMGGAGATAAEAMGGAAAWGANPASGGSALSNLLSGNGGASDYLSVGGNLLGAGLGVVGANQQADAYGDIAQQYLDMGKPYRDLLSQSYQPGFSMANQPDFMNSLNIGADAAARATSAKSGNPVENPGAYAEMQKYISGSLALPQLNQYRGQLGQFGGMGLNTAAGAASNQIQSQGGGWEAVGSGVENIFNPKKSIFDNPAFTQGLLSGYKINSTKSY